MLSLAHAPPERTPSASKLRIESRRSRSFPVWFGAWLRLCSHRTSHHATGFAATFNVIRDIGKRLCQAVRDVLRSVRGPSGAGTAMNLTAALQSTTATAEEPEKSRRTLARMRCERDNGWTRPGQSFLSGLV